MKNLVDLADMCQLCLYFILAIEHSALATLCTLFWPVLWIRIRTDPHLKSRPGSGSAWTDSDSDPDPGGKKA